MDGEPLRVVGIGASAGGIRAIAVHSKSCQVPCPQRYGCTHGSPVPADNLASVLARTTRLKVRPAYDGDQLQRCTCSVAPADKVLWLGTHLPVMRS